MLRAFFLAIGISLCILGGECLVVDQAVVKVPGKADQQSQTMYGAAAQAQSPSRREFSPPEWAPWTFLSVGFVVALYSLTVRRE